MNAEKTSIKMSDNAKVAEILGTLIITLRAIYVRKTCAIDYKIIMMQSLKKEFVALAACDGFCAIDQIRKDIIEFCKCQSNILADQYRKLKDANVEIVAKTKCPDIVSDLETLKRNYCFIVDIAKIINEVQEIDHKIYELYDKINSLEGGKYTDIFKSHFKKIADDICEKKINKLSSFVLDI